MGKGNFVEPKTKIKEKKIAINSRLKSMDLMSQVWIKPIDPNSDLIKLWRMVT